jgi:cardiolipin synthase
VRICRYGRRFLHAKHVTIDGAIAWIGSSNFDIRSFALNEEIVVLIYDRAICAELEAQTVVYLEGGEMLELTTWRKRPLALKVAENLARLLSPLL